MVYYRGVKDPNEAGPGQVWIEELGEAMPGGSMGVRPLAPRCDLRNHSPDGFQWGYRGSGPAQLALAILADATGNDRLALQLYQEFKRRFVSIWGQRWRISADAVRFWAATEDGNEGPERDDEGPLVATGEGAIDERG